MFGSLTFIFIALHFCCFIDYTFLKYKNYSTKIKCFLTSKRMKSFKIGSCVLKRFCNNNYIYIYIYIERERERERKREFSKYVKYL